MKRTKVYLAVFSTILIFLWSLPEGMLAQDANQAALVIRYSDQSVQTACVDFAEPEISGLELLQRSGLDMEMDVQGLGARVCSIGQTGCPSDDCWCQCAGGGDCIYWSYWHRLNAQWEYSQGGASMWTVRDGDVEGWSWGPGAVNAAYSPPDLAFEDVCKSIAVEDATATPTAMATATAIIFVPADTPASKATESLPTSTVTSTPMPTSTSSPTATISPAATAVPTNTLIPTATMTAEPVGTLQASSVPEGLEPTVAPRPSDSEPLAVVERELKSPATSEPSPTSLPLPVSKEESQPTPEAVVALAEVGGSLPTRQGEQDTKKRVEITAETPPALAVIGAGVQVPDLRVQPPDPENQIAGMENENGSSSFSYAVFGFIVFGLLGWLTITSIRGRERPVTFEE